MLWSSPLFWIAFAVFLFWALGAYNRLMRLRSAVVQSFGSFDAHMVRLVALLGEFGAAQTVQRGSLLVDAGAQELAALQGAVTQFSASLAVARARPLQGDAVAALAAAREVLRATWATALQKLLADPVQPTALTPAVDAGTGAPGAVPVGLSVWQVRWEEHAVQNEQAIRVFNEAVVQYNAAIAQFPVFHPLALMNANKGVFGVNLGHLWDEKEMMSEVLTELLGWWSEGKIEPVVDSVFPFSKAADAHDQLQLARNVGKVLLVPDA